MQIGMDALSIFISSSISQGQVALMNQVSWLCSLFQSCQQQMATSERLFSALRHVMSYLKSTGLPERLNYFMIFHACKDRTDTLCLKVALNELVVESSHNSNMLGKV